MMTRIITGTGAKSVIMTRIIMGPGGKSVIMTRIVMDVGCSLSQCHPFCLQSPINYLLLRPVCSLWLPLASYSSPNPLAPGHLHVFAR